VDNLITGNKVRELLLTIGVYNTSLEVDKQSDKLFDKKLLTYERHIILIISVFKKKRKKE
jgi:hypothetical protein